MNQGTKVQSRLDRYGHNIVARVWRCDASELDLHPEHLAQVIGQPFWFGNTQSADESSIRFGKSDKFAVRLALESKVEDEHQFNGPDDRK
jgi:hypothetical protein